MFLQIQHLNKCNVRVSCSNFGFFMGSNKKKRKTKVIVVPCLVDGDDFGTSAKDHEKLSVKNEDPKELHVENEKQRAN